MPRKSTHTRNRILSPGFHPRLSYCCCPGRFEREARDTPACPSFMHLHVGFDKTGVPTLSVPAMAGRSRDRHTRMIKSPDLEQSVCVGV